MRKEVVVAILLGLGIGSIITFGMYRAKQAVEQANSQEKFVPVDTTSTPNPSDPIQTTSLTIIEPPEDALSRTPSIRVTGKTTPHTTVVILLSDSETVTTADEQGNFSTPLTLTTGANIFTVRALVDSTTQTEILRTVVYSTNEFTDRPQSKTATSGGKLQ